MFSRASTMGDGIFDVQDQYNDIGWNGIPQMTTNSNNGSWWDDWGNTVFGQGVGLASQIFGAWGPRATQQITGGGTPIGGGYSPDQILGAAGQIQNQSNQAILAAQQQAAALAAARGNTGSNSLDGIFGSLTDTISRNPLIFAAGAFGLYLLMKEPPRGRR